MPSIAELNRLYDYSAWANEKLFQVIAQLTPEQFTQPVAGSYGSIRNTLVHTMSAEWGWLDRCGGQKRGPRLNPDDYPTFDSLRQKWSEVEGYVREFYSKLKEEELGRSVEYTFDPSNRRTMPLASVMHHAAIHCVHHRGQVALLLRVLGYAPGNFDILLYYGEKLSAPVL